MNRTFAVVVALALVGVTVFAPTAAAQSPAENVQTSDSPTGESLSAADPGIAFDYKHLRHGGGTDDDGRDPGLCGDGNKVGCP